MKQDDITAWIQRLNGVDEEAAHKIWLAYFPQLVRIAQKSLGTHPRRVVDEEDIALSAMKSFFRGAKAGRFSLNDRHDLWKLLTTITIRKVSAEWRRHTAKKRGGGGVLDEAALARPGELGYQLQLGEIALDQNRLPELAEAVARMCEDLLQELEESNLRQTALLKMEGFTNREIAEQLDCSVSRIKQRLFRIREKWQHHVASD